MLSRSFNVSSKIRQSLSQCRFLHKTALYDFHVEHGGKMVDFAGWSLPMQYSKLRVVQSHEHTRSLSSLFDVSHMLQFKITGNDRVKFLESVVVADVEGLKKDNSTLSLFTNENGGIIDDLVISNAGDYLYVVSNAGRSVEDWAHLQKHLALATEKGKDVQLTKLEGLSLLALQGPKSAEVLARFVDIDFNKFNFMSGMDCEIKNVGKCRITRCGYTGEDGFEISVPNSQATNLANLLVNESEVELAGLGARDSLRMEAGLCLYGNDIDESRTPTEAGLNWTIGKRRRSDENGFVGSDKVLSILKSKGGKQRRCGIVCDSKMVPRPGESLFNKDGEKVGSITSGGMSPMLKTPIAMAYVDKPFNKMGTELNFELRKKKFNAKVVKMPFVPANYFKSI